MPLRRWLFLVALAATLPLMVFTGYTIAVMADRQGELTLSELNAQGEHLAHLVEDHVDKARSTLSVLGDSDAIRYDRWTEFSAHAQRVVEANPEFASISLINRYGEVFVESGRPPIDAPVAAHDADSAEMAVKTGKLHVSNPQLLPGTNRGVIYINLPIKQGTEINLILRAAIYTETFQQAMRSHTLPLGTRTSLIDHEGDIIAANPAGVWETGTQAPANLRQAITDHITEPFQINDGQRNDTFSLEPLVDGNWFLSLAVPREALHEARTKLMLKTSIFGLIWLGVALLLTHHLAHRIQTQIGVILQAIKQEANTFKGSKRLGILEFSHLLSALLNAKSEAAYSKDSLIRTAAERDEVGDLYEHAPCAYTTLDAGGRITRVNKTLLRWLNLEQDQVVGSSFEALLCKADKERYRVYCAKTDEQRREEELTMDIRCADGVTLPVQVTMATMRNEQGQVIRTRMTLFDISERRRVEEQLIQQARTDALTGLSNRRDFERQADKEMSRCSRFHTPLCLLMIDVDHFKKINDTHGHEFGDVVLKALASLYAKSLRDTDTLARIGGEEFAVLMPMCSPGVAMEAAERLRRMVASHTLADPSGQPFQVTVSIGLSNYQKGDTRIDELMRRADEALYTAKNSGRNRTIQHGGP